MSGSLQNKLLSLEIKPPPEVWDKISIRLDQEFNAMDATISSRLENANAEPPPAAWENITIGLDEEGKRRTAKLVPLLYKRIAVAVILAGAVAVTVMYLFTGTGLHSTFNTTTASRNGAVRPYKPLINAGAEQVPSPANVIAQKPSGRLLPLQNIYSPILPLIPGVATQDEQEADVSNETSYLESVQTDVQTVQALKPVIVPAPLIRDANGRVIMDMNLINKSDGHYITVTGPNGVQTKISSKFLPCLSYLNGEGQDQSDVEGIRCSERFREWRDRLLSQPAYVPAANNFFDIFELQEMIQD